MKRIVFSAGFLLGLAVSLLAQQGEGLAGEVREAGRPLAGATVLLTGNGVRKMALSDDSGRFLLMHLSMGEYTLTVTQVGFEPSVRTVRLSDGHRTSLTLDLTPAARQLKEVAVSVAAPVAVDNLIRVDQMPLPVTIIDKKTIERMGSRRLDEVLREQTGLALVSDLGQGNRAVGLQMQGFSSEYIMILIDGQPMMGRVGGNFDLSRISISGIERIEIIRGATSSLYGSQALGGVVNIVTRQNSDHPEALVRQREGTYSTTDATVEGETPFAGHKGSVFVSGDYYKTGGFNVNPYLLAGSTTAPPYNSLSLQSRARYELNSGNILLFSGRYSGRHSVMNQDFGVSPTRDMLDEHDVNGMAALDTRLPRGVRLVSRYYLSRYSSLQNVMPVHGTTALESDNFTEFLHRWEEQAGKDFADGKLSAIGGLGGEYQQLNAQAEGGSGHMYNYFVYGQGTWKPLDAFSLIAGLRYDGNTVYGARLNPSAALRYSILPWLALHLSMGEGFKTPSYTEMYQVFTNLAQGYTVVGANSFAQSVQTMKSAGQLTSVWDIASQVRPLKAETSVSWNGGVTLTPMKSLEININGFYNSIRNLINTEQVGIKTNGAQLFSYINIGRAYTTGLEAAFQWTPLAGMKISAGYQLLYAKDRAVIDSIKTHSSEYALVRTGSGIRVSTAGDYFGLPGRSRHMANAQVFYSYRPWGLGLSVRGTYRSRYGFMDTDGNGFIDPYDVFVKGYFLLYASLQKKLLSDRLTLELTVDNITNYTDYLMPAQPGRMFFGGLSWRFFKQKDRKRLPI